MMSKRRNGKQIREEVSFFCQRPQFLSDILLKININHHQLMKMVDEGLVKKHDEKQNCWNGPLAHRYVVVKNVLR